MNDKADAWFFYSGYMYDMKKESGFIDELINKAKDKYGINLEVYSSHKFIVESGKENKLYYDGKLVEYVPKIVIMRRYEIFLGRQLEMMGAKVFNNIQALIDARNKMKTHQKLSYAGINTPKTLYVVPKKTVKNVFYDDVVNILGEKRFVMKWIYGSRGDHVYLVDNELDFDKIVKKYDGKVICQEFLKNNSGSDIRAYVIGFKFIGAAIRKGNNDFRSNLAKGGEAIKIECDDNMKKIAVDAAKACNLEICGVDLLIDNEGNYTVCEVNAVPGFKSLKRTINASETDIFLSLIKENL